MWSQKWQRENHFPASVPQYHGLRNWKQQECYRDRKGCSHISPNLLYFRQGDRYHFCSSLCEKKLVLSRAKRARRLLTEWHTGAESPADAGWGRSWQKKVWIPALIFCQNINWTKFQYSKSSHLPAQRANSETRPCVHILTGQSSPGLLLDHTALCNITPSL